MSIRLKIQNEEKYQVEVVFFLINYPIYREKLDNWYKDKSNILDLYDKSSDIDKKKILRETIIPDIKENEKSHFKLVYYNLIVSKAGRMYLNYLKSLENDKN